MRDFPENKSVHYYEGPIQENASGRALFYACLFAAVFALCGIAAVFTALHFEGQIWDAFSAAYNALLNLAAAR